MKEETRIYRKQAIFWGGRCIEARLLPTASYFKQHKSQATSDIADVLLREGKVASLQMRNAIDKGTNEDATINATDLLRSRRIRELSIVAPWSACDIRPAR